MIFPQNQAFDPDRLLDGRYRLLRELGRGGMGIVLAATDLEQQQQVAVKILLANPSGIESRDEIARRFRREFRAIQRLDHPNIVAVRDSGNVEGQAYFTMEIVEGQSLKTLLDLSSGRLSPEDLCQPMRLRQIIELFSQLCRGLIAIHGHRILHRDLKPSNLLVTPQGQLKIMDFGLVRTIDEDVSRLTQEGILVGTIAYMSPEQALGTRLDPRSDLYSVGVILYEALAGRRPFLDPSVTGLLLKQTHEKPYPISIYNPAVPAVLEGIALRLLEKDPFARFQSAQELLLALEAAASSLDRDPVSGALDLGSRSSQSAPPTLHPPRFIGREKELQQLSGRIDALALGQGGLVLLAGESGIGKSRFLEEVRSLGRLQQVQFLRGNCFEGSAVPYGAFLAPLERIAEQLARRSLEEQRLAVGPEGRALARISPRFLDLPAIAELPPLESLSPAQERYRIDSAVTTLLRQTASRRPITLLLEDLQWADALSTDLLAHLARNLVFPASELDAPELVAPILFLGTYRDDEIQSQPLQTLLTQLRRRRQLELLLLKRLDLDQVAQLLQSMLAMEEPPVHLARRIFQESEGNPFFIEEIMKSLLEEGILKRQAQTWILDYEIASSTSSLESRSLYAHLKIPVSIQEAVNKRLERLEPADRKILASAAVIGRAFSFELLLQVAELEEDQLLDAIDSFLKNQVITERTDARDAFDFYHAKIREVLYDGLRPRDKARHHLKIARAAERLYAEDLEPHVEFLAHHYFAAAAQDKAIEYLYKAGRSLQERYSNEEAVSHFRRALDLLEAQGKDQGPEQDSIRLSCLHGLGHVLRHMGNLPAAQEVFGQMEQLARDRAATIPAAQALLGLGQCEMHNGRYAQAALLAGKAREIFQQNSETLGLAFAHKLLAGIETFQHHFAEAAQHYGLALDLFETMGARQELASVLGDIGVNHHQQRQMEQAVQAYTRSIELSRLLGDPGGTARALINLGWACYEKGQYQQALDYYREAIQLQQKVGNRANLAVCYQNHGAILVLLGHYTAAISSCSRAVELSEELGQRYYLCQALCNQGDLFLSLGEPLSAQQALDKALQLAHQIEVPFLTARALLNLARLAQRQGDLAESLHRYRQACDEAQKAQDTEVFNLACLRLAWLAPDETRPEAWKTFVEQARDGGSQEHRIEVFLTAASLLLARAQPDPAQLLASEAQTLAQANALLEPRFLSLELLARTAQQQGRTDLAVRFQADAVGALEDLLEQVPPSGQSRFLGRPDVAASLAAARLLASQTDSPVLRTALEAFPEALSADVTRTVLQPVSPAVEEVTGVLDYEKLGVPGRRPHP